VPVVQPPDASDQNEKPEGLTHQQIVLETKVRLAVFVSAFQAYFHFSSRQSLGTRWWKMARRFSGSWTIALWPELNNSPKNKQTAQSVFDQ
jgi:hypothetical protein